MDNQHVLEAWHFTEAIAPIPLNERKGDHHANYFIEPQARKKFLSLASAGNLYSDYAVVEKYQMQFQFFCFCYPLYELTKAVRHLFQSEEELVNEDGTLQVGCSFRADADGQYVEGSLHVPLLHTVLHEALPSQTLIGKQLIARHALQVKQLENRAIIIFAERVDRASIEQLRASFLELFTVPPMIQDDYVEVYIAKQGTDMSAFQQRSFYLADLEAILVQGSNDTLKCFIEGVPFVEHINENQEAIERILQPKNLPLGRWPGPVKHRLSLMQQVAVNEAIHSKHPIASVNGPPGTGKTTLLKDLFSHYYVERAHALSRLPDPTQAFEKREQVKLTFDGQAYYTYNLFELRPELTNFAMVVASSNNTAVENISKDLPKMADLMATLEADGTPESDDYCKQLMDLHLWTDFGADLIGQPSWGLFSAALGKQQNISNYFDVLQGSGPTVKDNGGDSFVNTLIARREQLTLVDWDKAVRAYEQTREMIQKEIAALQKFSEQTKVMAQKRHTLEQNRVAIQALNEKLVACNRQVDYLVQEKEQLLVEVDNYPVKGWLTRLINRLFGRVDEELAEKRRAITEREQHYQTLKEEMAVIKKKQIKCMNLVMQLTDEVRAFEQSDADYQKQGVVGSDPAFWQPENYTTRQEQVLWQSDQLNYLRGLLFIQALRLHQYVLIFNAEKLKAPLALLKAKNYLNVQDEKNSRLVEQMWHVVHLITPVVSTTFASFGRMYKGIGKNFIPHLFIDEAGQSSPHVAVGALWRSRKAVVVGDPLQIEPVVTIDEVILEDIRKSFGVPPQFLSTTASVQTVADLANPTGMILPGGLRIGVPLWVHRRCIEPMFSIANAIAYDNQMVLASNKRKIGDSSWHHLEGETTVRQLVPAQVEWMATTVQDYIAVHDALPDWYIITPFVAVKAGLQEAVRKLHYSDVKALKKWCETNIGTVHTFQGKEATTVYFVTGTDVSMLGSINWSCQKPNLLNVAVTRAKENFYVVGDLNLFNGKDYYVEIIEKVKS